MFIQVKCLVDNYVYLFYDIVFGIIGIVDFFVVGFVVKVLKEKGLFLDYILNIYYYWDYIGGNVDLKKQYNVKVFIFSYN